MTPSPAASGLELLLQLRQRVFELRPGLGERAPPLRDRELRGDELMVERRDDDLDPVVLDEPNVVEQVLLRRQAPRRRAGGRAGQLVDELVDTAGGEDCTGAAGEEQLPSRQAHRRLCWGSTRTSEASSRFRFCTTIGNVSGGATCWLSVYSDPSCRQA